MAGLGSWTSVDTVEEIKVAKKPGEHGLVSSLNTAIKKLENNIKYWSTREPGGSNTDNWSVEVKGKKKGAVKISVKIGVANIAEPIWVAQADVEKTLSDIHSKLSDIRDELQNDGGIAHRDEIVSNIINNYKKGCKPGKRDKKDPIQRKPKDEGGMSYWDDKNLVWMTPTKQADGSWKAPE